MSTHFPDKPMTVTVAGRNWQGTAELQFHKYGNGRVALVLHDDEVGRITALSCNLPDTDLDDGEFVAKDYSENEGMIEDLIAQDVFVDTGKRVDSGHVTMPICRFHASKLEAAN